MEAVIVCTKYRGVFFGYTDNTEGDVITLKDPLMCVYWAESLRGVMGLASVGPNDECRISKPGVPEIELRGITAVIKTTQEAQTAWKEAPWK